MPDTESSKRRGRGIEWETLDIRRLPGSIRVLYEAMRDAYEMDDENAYEETRQRFYAAVKDATRKAKGVGSDCNVSVVYRPAIVQCGVRKPKANAKKIKAGFVLPPDEPPPQGENITPIRYGQSRGRQ